MSRATDQDDVWAVTRADHVAPTAVLPVTDDGTDEAEPADTEDLDASDEDTGDIEVDVAANRARRLELSVLALAGTVAAMLATLALPWVSVNVDPTVIEVPSGTGMQRIVTQGGAVTHLGRDVGAFGPMLVLGGFALVVGLAAHRRWWWVIAGGIVFMIKAGLSAPTVESLSGSQSGQLSLAVAESGMQYARYLYLAFVGLTIVTALQTWIVWKAEKDWAEFGERLAGAYRAVRKK